MAFSLLLVHHSGKHVTLNCQNHITCIIRWHDLVKQILSGWSKVRNLLNAGTWLTPNDTSPEQGQNPVIRLSSKKSHSICVLGLFYESIGRLWDDSSIWPPVMTASCLLTSFSSDIGCYSLPTGCQALVYCVCGQLVWNVVLFYKLKLRLSDRSAHSTDWYYYFSF